MAEDHLEGKQNALEIAEALEAAERDERHRLASEFADRISTWMVEDDEPREDS